MFFINTGSGYLSYPDLCAVMTSENKKTGKLLKVCRFLSIKMNY